MESSMAENDESQAETNGEETQETNDTSRQAKTWYPYITKVQFEKFLARLESKMPEQIDRDYVRAIIRTPSMIYRFLRGIEAMKFIDREQCPTPLLQRVVNPETRAFALAEVQRDLYKDLLEEQTKSGEMNDEEIVEYFRDRTGMGRDSANKMKMFFKYLNGEADFSQPAAQPQEEEQADTKPAEEAVVEERAPEPEAKAAKPSKEETPAPQRSQNRERGQQERNRETRQERNRESREARQERNQTRQERSESSNSNAAAAGPPRPLTEQQKAYLDTVRSVVSINIDGDWDEDMIRVAFDRLERLLDRIRRI
jgi:chemotaxis protein histidine kinase CheA